MGRPDLPPASPGLINTSVMTPTVMGKLDMRKMICSIDSRRYESARHLLSNSILIDNCDVVYLVNNEGLLVKDPFKLVSRGDGSTRFSSSRSGHESSTTNTSSGSLRGILSTRSSLG